MALSVNVLGELEVVQDGLTIALPPSRKTRALLGFLASNEGQYRREYLCELFWNIPDDPRGALRWSLSKLRAIVNTDSVKPLTATRNHVSLKVDEITVDIAMIRRSMEADAAAIPTHQLERHAGLFRGEFLEGLDIPGCPEFQIWCHAERENIRKLHIDLLKTLVERLEGQSDKALFYARKWAEADPLDEGAHSAVVRILSVSGRKKEAEVYHGLGLKILKNGNIDPDGRLDTALKARRTAQISVSENTKSVPPVTPELYQDIRFCQASDGIKIALSTAGSGLPIVKAANFLNHLEYDWESPVWRHLISDIAAHNTLIRYDERGTGLSDWDVGEITFEDCVSDLEAVVDTLGLEKFILFGISQGAAVSIAYAARHPERVEKMILHGGYALGWKDKGTPEQKRSRDAMVTLMEAGWGQNNPMFRQLFTSQFIPDATLEQYNWFNELQLISTSPENAVKLEHVNNDIDVRDLAKQITTPTLVTHSRGEARVPFEAGRRLAMAIPKARFVPLESNNHLILEQEPAWQRFRTVFRGFVEADT
jgi:DNA-binding SARP family transcriptional activator/pimeloyl-ACP methyl ester carboxylesterase